MKLKTHGLNFNIAMIGITAIYLILFWKDLFMLRAVVICWAAAIILQGVIISLMTSLAESKKGAKGE